MTKILTIRIEEDNEEMILELLDRIHYLLSEGYTSGIDPTWDIKEEE